MRPAPGGTTPPLSAAVARATTAAAVTALAALLALLSALAWPAFSRPALVLLLTVPLVRNVVLAMAARGRERQLAVLGAALLLATALLELR